MEVCLFPTFPMFHSLNLIFQNPQAILDFSQPEFNVALLDQVVTAFYSGSGQQVRVCDDYAERDAFFSWIRLTYAIAISATTRAAGADPVSRTLGVLDARTLYPRAIIQPPIQGTPSRCLPSPLFSVHPHLSTPRDPVRSHFVSVVHRVANTGKAHKYKMEDPT